MKNILGIMDQDERYSALLAENLAKRESFPFEISGFNDKNRLLKLVQQNKIAAVLMSETMYERVGKQNLPSDINLIILNEGKGIQTEFPKIWKYQSAEKIRKDFLKLASDFTGFTIESVKAKGNEAKIIGVMSCIASNEATEFALSLANQMSKNGKTLYLNLKEFSSASVLAGECIDGDITDLICMLRNGDDKFLLSLESLLKTVGRFDMIPPVGFFMDLKAVKKEDWLNLLKAIKNKVDYKQIVIDFSSVIDGYVDILNACDEVVALYGSSASDSLILKQYLDQLKELDYDDLVEKTKCIKLSRNISVSDLRELEQLSVLESVKIYLQGDSDGL